MQITIDQETFHKLAVAAGYVRLNEFIELMDAAVGRALEKHKYGARQAWAEQTVQAALDAALPTHSGGLFPNPEGPQARQATREETLEQTRRNNPQLIRTPESQHAFLDTVTALEERERDFDKPAEQGPAPTRKEVEAAFRAMIENHSSQEAALAAGRRVLSKLGVKSVPAIPEDKFVECMRLLKELS